MSVGVSFKRHDGLFRASNRLRAGSGILLLNPLWTRLESDGRRRVRFADICRPSAPSPEQI
jgi:hypothetical protein